MKVKDLKKGLLMVMALLALVLLPGSAGAEENVINIPVGIVEDISTAHAVRGSSSDNFNSIYSFTLEKPAIVRVSASENIYEHAVLAGVTAVVCKDQLGTSPVVNGKMGWVDAEGKEIMTWLEAGTYYVLFKATYPDEYLSKTPGTTSIGICAEYIDKTGNGNTSFKKAAAVNLNKEVEGFFSDTNRKQYYKFTLKSKSSVTIRMTADKKDGAGDNGKYHGILCNSEYEEIVNKEMSKDGTSESITKTLNKGTYYVVMDASDSSWYYGKTELKVTAKAVPADPKVTSVKKNTAAVKGTAVKGATVYASYNGETYSAKVNSKGSYTIKTAKLVKGKSVKVYAKLNGLKSGTKTYKIK